MAFFRKTLVRIGCVVLTACFAYQAFSHEPADWGRTIIGIVLASLFLSYLIFDLFEDRIRNSFHFFSHFSIKYIRLVVSDKRTEIYGILPFRPTFDALMSEQFLDCKKTCHSLLA